MLTFNTENMVRQKFDFPAPIMDYIFKNVQPQHLIKLYQTCKFFYHKYRRNIILNLEIVADREAEVWDPIKSVIRHSNPSLDKLNDFWITDSLVCRVIRTSGVIPLFSDYTVKKLDFSSFLLFKEFEILTYAGTIEELKIGSVYYGSGRFASVEDIIAQVPGATSIDISDIILTPTTCASLASLNHKAKISNVFLRNVSAFQHFNIKHFLSFLLTNAAVVCNVRLEFKLLYGDGDLIHAINELIKTAEAYFNDVISGGLKLSDLEKSKLLSSLKC
uniref:F-box domain-containing protein n=1 Tax=Panagrolaimus sp. ES5 TaxID=591445 RepID=A0AC34FHA6_9BILA